MTLLCKFARIPIGVAVIVVVMEDNHLLFCRCGKDFHLILGVPVGFETQLGVGVIGAVY